MAKRKFLKRVSAVQLAAPAASANARDSATLKIKPKGRPRGRSFEKGHGYGVEHRFKPGQSGNPSGRSRAEQIAAAKISEAAITRLGQIGNKKLLQAAGSKSFCERLADQWIAAGLAGNVGAIASLSDRVEGRPGTSLTVDGNDNPVAFLIASMDARSDQIGLAEGRQRQLTQGGEDGRSEETAIE